jgi:hypothetical protein
LTGSQSEVADFDIRKTQEATAFMNGEFAAHAIVYSVGHKQTFWQGGMIGGSRTSIGNISGRLDYTSKCLCEQN